MNDKLDVLSLITTDWIEKYRRMWERRYLALDGLLEELQTMQAKGARKK